MKFQATRTRLKSAGALAFTGMALLPTFGQLPQQQALIDVTVTFTNDAPATGLFLTPPWVGFHDGTFDTYDQDAPSSPALERIAEDGNAAPLSEAFLASGSGFIDGVLNEIGPLAPGSRVSQTFRLNPLDPNHRFFSYTSMVIPSNDAYVANGNPQAHALFDDAGNFTPLTFTIQGNAINDAGTEINDEIPANTAFFGQTAPNTGESENGVNRPHPGFRRPGSENPGILDDPMFAMADFVASGYNVATVSLTATPVSPPVNVTLTIRNEAPENGLFLTPTWIGVHDGNFDLFNTGEAASPALERIAEDGNTGPLTALFAETDGTGFDLTLATDDGVPPFAPGEETQITLRLDPNNPSHRYLSFASMVIPSNDAFVGNSDPMAYPLFDDAGNFIATEALRMGARVYDAGTEVNDELPANTAFFGQATPDTGEAENGTIALHPGFRPSGSGGILDDPMFAQADFTSPGYPLFRLEIAESFAINETTFDGENLSLTWNGGQPPFQVQWSSDLINWEDMGEPIDSRTALVPVPSDVEQRFYRVTEFAEIAPLTATYEVTFQATWSAATHPTDFPSNPHFSGLIGATHNAQTVLWEPGGVATPGIRNMAETGGKSPLTSELQDLIDAGMAEALVSGGGISRSPGDVSVTFTTSQEFPLLSLTSMIAPSPDWFVGVHGLPLFQDGRWVDEMVVDLDPYDAGTDSGLTFTSPNAPTTPQIPIERVVEPLDVNGTVPPLGTFTIRRLAP